MSLVSILVDIFFVFTFFTFCSVSNHIYDLQVYILYHWFYVSSMYFCLKHLVLVVFLLNKTNRAMTHWALICGQRS